MTTSAEICPDAEATRAHAARTLTRLKPGTIIRLHGPLGAGKSEWVRGLAAALGVPGPVPSPTFTLCQPLRGGRLPLDHWDLYRLEQARDWDSLGWPDCLVTSGLVAVEWPDRFPGKWPDTVADLEITPQPDGTRQLRWIQKP
jgi:tRNA threonylcarbamoyladenosine biosynthesis protein TsaE